MHWNSAAISIFIAILPIVNPIGMAPVFLNMTGALEPAVRHRIAKQIAIYFFSLLVVFLLLGQLILRFFGLEVPYIKIAGGLLVFYSAWEMLNTTPKLNDDEHAESKAKAHDIAFFPLTMPITAGAGTLAMIMAFGTKVTVADWMTTLRLHLGAVLGIAAITLLVYVCYRFADVIFTRLGHIGTNIVSKISAFILLAISVEIIWDGIRALH